MRRLTLILSDLYLPAESDRGRVPGAILDLPSLEWLLRFASRGERVHDWRAWLAADAGRPVLGTLPVAALAARGIVPEDSALRSWLATPARLEARLDHVRLVDRGLPRLEMAEREAWIEDFARAFAPSYQLHDAGPRGFLLSGLAPTRARSVDPARLLDADVGKAVPRGADVRELNRLRAEVEMWMHGSPVNLERERAKRPRLSTLWLWGGGAFEMTSRADSLFPPAMSTIGCFGEDPWFASFARSLSGRNPEPVPDGWAAIAGLEGEGLVEVTPMSGEARLDLPSLEARWFGPLRESLSSGGLRELSLVANDRLFRIHRRAALRFWRRRDGWLAQLQRRAAARA